MARLVYPIWFLILVDILNDLWVNTTGALLSAITPPVEAGSSLITCLRGDPMMDFCLVSFCRHILQ